MQATLTSKCRGPSIKPRQRIVPRVATLGSVRSPGVPPTSAHAARTLIFPWHLQECLANALHMKAIQIVKAYTVSQHALRWLFTAKLFLNSGYRRSAPAPTSAAQSSQSLRHHVKPRTASLAPLIARHETEPYAFHEALVPHRVPRTDPMSRGCSQTGPTIIHRAHGCILLAQNHTAPQ